MAVAPDAGRGSDALSRYCLHVLRCHDESAPVLYVQLNGLAPNNNCDDIYNRYYALQSLHANKISLKRMDCSQKCAVKMRNASSRIRTPEMRPCVGLRGRPYVVPGGARAKCQQQSVSMDYPRSVFYYSALRDTMNCCTDIELT